jgi:hypothetical protein
VQLGALNLQAPGREQQARNRPLRRVLAVPDAPVPDDPIDLVELRADVVQFDRIAWASCLDELQPVLPLPQRDGDERRAALALLPQVCGSSATRAAPAPHSPCS